MTPDAWIAVCIIVALAAVLGAALNWVVGQFELGGA